MLYVCYPKCTTCKKAQAFLDAQGASYDLRDIKLDNPSESELRTWHAKSGLPLKKFFNTSGLIYRGMELSKKLPTMSEDEQFALLATDGMLVKRPILVTDTTVLVGFSQAQWEETI
ncbi:arsenate reductase family protein [Bengtsoniella intestinalis]|uniref:arsenate reductase family protein n=1 Tax=Bengtsoniella intestinalis TaxID=3073143 RepID=UPI00391F0A87